MKKITRLVALALSLLLAVFMLAPVTTALADPGPAPATGSLFIHKYQGYGGEPGSGDRLTGADNPGLDHDPLNGVRFDIYLIDTSQGAPAGGDMAYQLDDTDASQPLLRVNDRNGDLQGVYALTPASVPDVVTGSGTNEPGVGIAADLPQGVYLVVEDFALSQPVGTDGRPVIVSMPAEPFIVSIPMLNKAGDGWLTYIHAYPKNEIITVSKTVGLASNEAVVIGQTVPFTITASIPVEIAASHKYDIVDTFDPAFEYQPNSVVVKADPSEIELQAATATSDNDYVATYDPGSRQLRVSLTPTGLSRLDSSTTISVSFQAEVTKSQLLGNMSAQNEGQLEFANQYGTQIVTTTDGSGPIIHTAAIKIEKTDASGQGLEGATFRIATSSANVRAGHFLKITDGHILLDAHDPGYDDPALPYYEVSPTLVKGNAQAPAVAWFSGLKDHDGTAYQTYYIVETVAPLHYNRLTAPDVVTFSDRDYIDDQTGIVLVAKIKNHSGFVLPVTGGDGTVIFAASGLALLGLAIIIAINQKRKKRNLQNP